MLQSTDTLCYIVFVNIDYLQFLLQKIYQWKRNVEWNVCTVTIKMGKGFYETCKIQQAFIPLDVVYFSNHPLEWKSLLYFNMGTTIDLLII